jgi:hypothetical protein
VHGAWRANARLDESVSSLVASEKGLLLDFPCGNDSRLSLYGSRRAQIHVMLSGANTRNMAPEMTRLSTSGTANCRTEDFRKRQHSPSSETESSVDSVAVIVVFDVVLVVVVVIRHTITVPAETIVDDAAIDFTED